MSWQSIRSVHYFQTDSLNRKDELTTNWLTDSNSESCEQLLTVDFASSHQSKSVVTTLLRSGLVYLRMNFLDLRLDHMYWFSARWDAQGRAGQLHHVNNASAWAPDANVCLRANLDDDEKDHSSLGMSCLSCSRSQTFMLRKMQKPTETPHFD